MQPEFPDFENYVTKLYNVSYNGELHQVNAVDSIDARKQVAKKLFGSDWEKNWKLGLAYPATKRYVQTPDDYSASERKYTNLGPELGLK